MSWLAAGALAAASLGGAELGAAALAVAGALPADASAEVGAAPDAAGAADPPEVPLHPTRARSAMADSAGPAIRDRMANPFLTWRQARCLPVRWRIVLAVSPSSRPLEWALRMPGTETKRQVDVRLGGDAVGGGAMGLAVDRLEDPRRDRRSVETGFRARERRIHGAARPVRVSVEALPGRTAEMPVGHKPLLDRRRAQAVGPAEALPDAGRGSERDVDAGQVHELERTHRKARGAHRAVDPLGAGIAGFEHPQRLDGERPVDPVDDEARGVGGPDRGLAPGRHQRRHPVGHPQVRGRRAHDLDE